MGDAHGASPLHQAQGLAGWDRSRPGAAVSTPIGAAGVAPAAVRLAGDSGAAVGAAGLVWGAAALGHVRWRVSLLRACV